MIHGTKLVRSGVAAALLCGTTFAAAGPANAADMPVAIPPPVVVAPVVAQPGPSFYAMFSGLYMTRSSPAVSPILNFAPEVSGFAVEDLPPNLEEGGILDASHFDFGWALGFQARAGVTLPGNFGVEVGGFWLRPLTAERADGGEPIPVQLETTPPTADYFFATGFEALNTTRIFGLDANVVAHLNGGTAQIYAGVAYIRLRDALDMVLFHDGPQEDPTTFDMAWETDNRMIGPQIGARATFGGGNSFSVTVDGRVGFLRNAITSTASVETIGGLVTGDDAGTVWSFMAAGGITANWALSETVTLNVGYQALFLNDVALAPHQVIGMEGPLVGPSTADLTTYTSRVLFHGVSAGITINF